MMDVVLGHRIANTTDDATSDDGASESGMVNGIDQLAAALPESR